MRGVRGPGVGHRPGLGFDGLSLAVLRGHVDAQSHDEMVEAFLSSTVDQVIAGLTTPIERDGSATAEPSALDVVARGTIDEIHRLFTARGWSDGLAIIPPTRARVEAVVAAGGYDPWRVMGTAPRRGVTSPSGRSPSTPSWPVVSRPTCRY